MSQRHHRVHAHGAEGWDIACCQRNCQKQQAHAYEGQSIGCENAEEQSLQEARQRQGEEEVILRLASSWVVSDSLQKGNTTVPHGTLRSACSFLGCLCAEADNPLARKASGSCINELTYVKDGDHNLAVDELGFAPGALVVE
jgi:hypothetical protein